MLIIKNLFKKIKDKVILQNINLEIPPGSIAILLGKSGVGKSTLLRLLNNLEPFDSGNIF